MAIEKWIMILCTAPGLCVDIYPGVFILNNGETKIDVIYCIDYKNKNSEPQEIAWSG